MPSQAPGLPLLGRPPGSPQVREEGRERRREGRAASVCPEGKAGPFPWSPPPCCLGSLCCVLWGAGSRWAQVDRGELTIAFVRPQPWGTWVHQTRRPSYSVDTMHPSRRSLPFPLNCQLVRVGTADYGGASDQVRKTLQG